MSLEEKTPVSAASLALVPESFCVYYFSDAKRQRECLCVFHRSVLPHCVIVHKGRWLSVQRASFPPCHWELMAQWVIEIQCSASTRRTDCFCMTWWQDPPLCQFIIKSIWIFIALSDQICTDVPPMFLRNVCFRSRQDEEGLNCFPPSQ